MVLYSKGFLAVIDVLKKEVVHSVRFKDEAVSAACGLAAWDHSSIYLDVAGYKRCMG